MGVRGSARLGVLLLALASAAAVAGTGAEVAGFPRFVTSVDGERLDLRLLAERQTLVVVTLKATWCPVCQNQLRRLEKRLAELSGCGAAFLVLAPGPASELRDIRDKTRFPYPFVEDVDLRIAQRLGLVLGEGEIVPSILVLDADLSVAWMQRGRSGGVYGDEALARQLGCGSWI